MTRRDVQASTVPGLVVLTLTALVTWPQCLYMATRIAAHDDPLFKKKRP
jgi:hypothetical protein